MAKDDGFKKAIAAANSGKRFPAMSLVRDDPVTAATISKLITGIEAPHYGMYGERETIVPNIASLQNLSQETGQNITDAQTVMQILPDTELSAQILISSILSPKDMMTTELNYSVIEGLLAPEVSSALVGAARSHFEQDYKIKPLLGKILRDVLFETGSYAAATIPENSLDDLINGSSRITMEGLLDTINRDGTPRARGLLGPAVATTPRVARQTAGFAIESLNEELPAANIEQRITFEGLMAEGSQALSDTFVSVTDNPDVLKLPQINQKIREQRILKTIRGNSLSSFGRAMESHPERQPKSSQNLSTMSDRQLTSLLYKNKQFKYKPIASMRTQEQLNRRAVGNPLIVHLPSEAVIPVHVPGCPEAQIGYFVLIDADGNPVRKPDNDDYYRELSTRLTANGSFPSAMLAKMKGMMGGYNPRNPQDLDAGVRAYGDMVEKDLLARLRNGVYGNGVKIGRREEIWRIMLARALAKQHTQLLFLPAELMTYFAFKYTSNGIGKSLMDDMKILNSLRAMCLFSNVMASIKNSIGRTDVKIKLDPEDPDPQKTISVAQHEIIKSRSQFFPIGVNRPSDLVDYLQRAGIRFGFEGHPGMPDVDVSFSETNTNYVKPDTELEESLRKRSIMGLGLSPENVDAGFTAEFATSILNNNILLSKRVMQMQEVFTPQLSNHLRQAMMNSESLMQEMRDILESNFDKLVAGMEVDDESVEQGKKRLKLDEEFSKDENARKALIDRFLHEFVMNFEVTLPQPNTVTLENQLVALETYTKGLDATLDAYLSEKFYTTDVGGEIANQVATVKEILKAYFLRQWLAENGVMTELAALTTLGSDGNPAVNVYDAQVSHMEALGKSLTELMTKLQPGKEETNKEVADLNLTGAQPPADTSSDDSGGGDDDGGGFDTDLDLGGGPPGSEEEPDGEETPPAGTEEEEEPTDDQPAADKPAGDEAGATT